MEVEADDPRSSSWESREGWICDSETSLEVSTSLIEGSVEFDDDVAEEPDVGGVNVGGAMDGSVDGSMVASFMPESCLRRLLSSLAASSLSCNVKSERILFTLEGRDDVGETLGLGRPFLFGVLIGHLLADLV